MAIRQQQRQNVSTEVTYRSSADPGIGYSNGIMVVDGVLQQPVKAMDFESSNGLSRYTAIEWAHPGDHTHRFSCNCPGFTKRSERNCKHLTALQTGNMAKVKLVTQRQIQSVADAVASGLPDGKELRGFMFGS